MRRTAISLLVVLLVAACQAEAPPAPTTPAAGETGPPTSPAATPTGAGAAPTDAAPTQPIDRPPAGTPDPNASPPPIARPPLPEPELDDPTAVGEAIASPQRRVQGVVSMLRGLGIGIYRTDGTAIRAGDERAPGDPWLYEDEVHSLVAMAAAESRTNFIRFTDWHAALRELGLTMSANELLDAYVETYLYDWENESFFVKMALAQGLDLVEGAPSETYLTRLHAWLLLLDGFVAGPDDSVGGVRALPHAGPAFIASNHEEKWGGASSAIRKPLTGAELGVDWFEAAQRLETLARAVPFTIIPTSQRAHEGHRREGDPVSYEVWFTPGADIRLTPFGDDFFLQPAPDPDNLTVSWQPTPAQTLTDHGTLRDAWGSGDPLAAGTRTVGGRTGVTFVPKREEADEQGLIAEDALVLNATAPLHEIARRTWSLPTELLGYLQRGGGTASARAGEQVGAVLEIEWHGLQGLQIEMVDEYDITIEFPKVRGAEMSIGEVKRVGKDTFKGFLALREDGTWRGTMRGTTRAEYYERAFDQDCTWSISAEQDLIVTAELTDYGGHGDDPGPTGIVLRFFPAAPPELNDIRCDYDLPFHWGSEPYEDPEVKPREAIPSQFYAPFNDQRIINTEIGFPTGYQPGMRATGIKREFAPGIGGGTWTVTIEEIDRR
ncbi:MAG TPA: hypothetical protein VNT28_01595 [Candidatus Limnocylindrales bacterium]|jgi:hypothetical protein|nr:hypothetical protein [Candidatus Limnocylindrales bacterium]